MDKYFYKLKESAKAETYKRILITIFKNNRVYMTSKKGKYSSIFT